MRALLKILVILIIASCQVKTNKNSKDSINAIDSEIVRAVDEPNETIDDKTFMVFFENFMWDSEFQNERIIFPINYFGKQLDSKHDWKFSRFYTKKSYMPILHTDTITYFDKDITENIVKMSIVSFENQESKNFSFKKTDDGWKLFHVETQHIDSLNDFDFIDFLKLFSSDSLYQMEHVVFPIPHYYVDQDNDYETLYDSLNIENWMYLQIDNNLEGIISLNSNIDSDYRMIFFRGIDNGIHIKYTFKKIDDVWKLIKIEDYST